MNHLSVRRSLSTLWVAALILNVLGPGFVSAQPVAVEGASARDGFVHPGCLSRQEDLERMARKVAAGEEPWASSWAMLVRNTDRWLDHEPEAVAVVQVFPSGGRTNFIRLARDAHRCYQLALRYHGSGDARFADKAVEIFNAWASIHGAPRGDRDDIRRDSEAPRGGGDSDGHRGAGWSGDSNVALRQGLYGYQFACAAELLRDYPGWRRDDFAAFQAYMLESFYRGNSEFMRRRFGTVPTHYWANWVQANQASIMAIGVLCDDRAIFNEGLDYFHNGPGNANINHAVTYVHPDGLGQWQESGRDQGHSLMGPQLTGTICEIAWNQGIDLYGAQQNRFLAGVEYVSKYNLGYDVPWTTYVYVYKHPGQVRHQVLSQISASGRGASRPGWDLVYHHYVNRMGLSAPWTGRYAQRVGPEGGGFNYSSRSGGFDGLGFTTLTHSRDPIAQSAPPSALRPVVQGRQITLSWAGSAHAQSYTVKRATDPDGPYTTLDTVAPPCQSYVDVGLTAGQTYHYTVTANLPEGQTPASPPASATATGKLEGTLIGGGDSKDDPAAMLSHAMDGSLSSYFDPAHANGWVGLDLGPGVSASLTEVRYAPRDGHAEQMVGGMFQGSNDGRDWTTIHTITRAPTEGEWTGQSIRGSAAYRFVRYIRTDERRGWCDVAEVAFYGDVRGLARPRRPAAPTIRKRRGRVELTWPAAAGASSYNVRRAPSAEGPYILIGNTRDPRMLAMDPDAGPGFYTVSAVNAAGESRDSEPVAVD